MRQSKLLLQVFIISYPSVNVLENLICKNNIHVLLVMVLYLPDNTVSQKYCHDGNDSLTTPRLQPVS